VIRATPHEWRCQDAEAGGEVERVWVTAGSRGGALVEV